MFVQSLSLAKLPKSQICSSSLLNSTFLHRSNPTSVTFCSVSHHHHHHHLPKCFLFQLPGGGGGGVRPKAKEKRNLSIVHASEIASPTTNESERWLLEPIGDGDSRHIGFKVEMPGAYEIASSEVTVGRVPEKADLVIPVATVSGVHARIQKKQGNLLVTDLDSTNGTFIDDKRLRPGVVATISSGSCITFGDTHLAMFRVLKVEDMKAVEGELDTDNKRDETQTS
ncbi:hypothetical protein VNO77_44668 [Canavalia gladiata]|uniref:FHA domain-containing protein n=1 Tax=Canavalia gladiata TaxID=3824 RepID=A0AAN9JXF5_CANGL